MNEAILDVCTFYNAVLNTFYLSRSPDSTNFWFIEAESWLSFILLQQQRTDLKGENHQNRLERFHTYSTILTRRVDQLILQITESPNSYLVPDPF